MYLKFHDFLLNQFFISLINSNNIIGRIRIRRLAERRKVPPKHYETDRGQRVQSGTEFAWSCSTCWI